MSSSRRALLAVAILGAVGLLIFVTWAVLTSRTDVVTGLLTLLTAVVAALLVWVVREVRRARSRVAKVHAYLGRHERRESRDRHAGAERDAAVTDLAGRVEELRGLVAALVTTSAQDRAEAVVAVEQLGEAVDALRAETTTQAERAAGDREALTAQLAHVRAVIDRAEDPDERLRRGRSEFAQLEALLDLRTLLPPDAPMLPSRGWAAAPTTLMAVVRAVLERRPELIVECGSGVSSVWIGLLLRKLGQGRCVALEHDEAFATQTRDELRRHGLDGVVEVRTAPLVEVEAAGGRHLWYDPVQIEDLHGIGVVFVDGPPGATGPRARFPALPLLGSRCAAGAVVVLDDADRPEEREVVAAWQELGATVLASSREEKGWTALAVPTT